MSAVEFNTYKTNELGVAKLASLVKNFNEVFEKELPVSFFEQQYGITVKGYSFHSVMEKEGEVVGACSAVPYEYTYNGETKLFTLLTGLFVTKEFRKDPFALYKIYSRLKDMMTDNGVSFTMAVPNHNSYPYFKHVLKWKDIGNLPYYALPVRYGNIKKGSRMLNIASWIFAHSFSVTGASKNILVNHRQKEAPFRLIPNEPVMEDHRYTDAHKKLKQKNVSAFYRTDNEEGIRTSYLIDFYNAAGKKDSRSLSSAVKFILNTEKPDIIIFIGPLRFSQFSLIKVPESKEPRKLNFCGEILIKDEIGEDIFDYNKWDFGLYNFDVR